MDADDRQVGRVLRRREVLALLGAAGGAVVLSRTGLFSGRATVLAQAPAPSCVVKPELTEGPYFVDDQLDRSDIRSEPSDGIVRDGVPLALTFNVTQVGGGGCTALAGARVDVWHCDALGVYSGVTDNSFPASTVGEKFLRGYQMTDTDGAVRFLTIYPGWYAGRRGAYPLQDPHDRDGRQRVRVHVATVHGRRDHGPGTCRTAVRQQAPEQDAQQR